MTWVATKCYYFLLSKIKTNLIPAFSLTEKGSRAGPFKMMVLKFERNLNKRSPLPQGEGQGEGGFSAIQRYVRLIC